MQKEKIMNSDWPGQGEVGCFYRKHLGPRMESAGLRVGFHYNQKPGIYFKVEPREEHRSAILKGIRKAWLLVFQPSLQLAAFGSLI
jgi:hypothetical protein